MMEVVQCNQHAQGMVAYWELSVGLCCWESEGHKARKGMWPQSLCHNSALYLACHSENIPIVSTR